MTKNISVWLDKLPDKQRYPSLTGEHRADVVVIGGGIAGVSVAWRLTQAGVKVMLIEKNHIATGDTSATTGFILRGPDTSVMSLKEKYGIEFVKKIYTATRRAQLDLFDIIKNNKIDCDFQECNSYYSSYTKDNEELRQEFEIIRQADEHVSWVTGEKKATQPFAEAIEYKNEGKFFPRKYLFALLEKAKTQGLQVFEETDVLGVEAGNEAIVRLPNGTIKAKKVVITIGDPSPLFPELKSLIEPRISYVMAAKYQNPPLTEDLFWDTLEPYFYYRRINADTVILGGADIAFDKIHSQNPWEKLENFITDHLPGSYMITHRWSGSLFYTADGLPYIFSHPHFHNQIFIATGWGGNGLLFSNLASHILCDLAQEKQNEWADLFSPQRTNTVIPKPVVKSTSLTQQKQFTPFAAVNEFGQKKYICKKIGGTKIVVFKLREKFYAINNTCTHAGGSLCDGTLIDEGVIECPLHAGQFNVMTGEVVAPPPTRAVETYAVKVEGDQILVEADSTSPGLSVRQSSASSDHGQIEGSSRRASSQERNTIKKAPTKKKTYWGLLLKFSLFPVLFWIAQFLMQYYWLTKGEVGGSLVRSFGLSAATFFGFALFSSAIFKWLPKTAVHWRIRRYLGVSGAVFMIFHILGATHYLFLWQIQYMYYSFNPLTNPIIFGSIAYPIFLIMALTSTDWAVQKIGAKRWKNIHRLVYIAYISSIFHFITINPTLLKNPPGYFLLGVTALALFGQLFWFIKISAKRKFRSIGSYVGLGIILATLVVGYFVYKKFVPTVSPPAESTATIPQEESLETSVEKMKAFMKENPADPDIATQPLKEATPPTAQILKTGAFQNLNYMSSGGASLQKIGEKYFIVFEKDFVTPNGPDVQLYLTKNSDHTQRSDIAQGIPLGKLKSLKGKQLYEIPAETNIEEYHSVSLHCKAFNVPWSYAPLK